jgi:hypothetical protein
MVLSPLQLSLFLTSHCFVWRTGIHNRHLHTPETFHGLLSIAVAGQKLGRFWRRRKFRNVLILITACPSYINEAQSREGGHCSQRTIMKLSYFLSSFAALAPALVAGVRVPGADTPTFYLVATGPDSAGVNFLVCSSVVRRCASLIKGSSACPPQWRFCPQLLLHPHR